MIRFLKMMRTMVGSRVRGQSMMSCEEALNNLVEHLDHELDETTSRRVQEHIDVCRKCYTRAQFERAFLAAIARSSASGPPVPERLQDQVLAMLGDRREPEAGG